MKERKTSVENEKRRRRSKTRRLSVNFKRDSTSREAKENKQGQENMEVESSFPSDEKKSISENAKEPVTEDAQLELRLVQRENVQLKKQIHDSHLTFVEKTSELERQLNSLEKISGNQLPMAAEAAFQEVHKLLNQMCDKFFQGSNFLSEALHLIGSLLVPTKGQKKATPHIVLNAASPYVDPASNCVCTTPPPDEPSAMEITDIQSTIIENNDTIMKNLDRGFEKDLPKHLEQENLNIKVESNVTAMESSQSSRRAKRKSSTSVSYAEPKLCSKLRRGDPFTDSSLFGDELQLNYRKRKRSLTKGTTTLPVMGNRKKRPPLANLTNTIAEES